MSEEKESLVDKTDKFDPVSLEFRKIIDDHVRLITYIDEEDMMDLDRQEKKEEANRQNINVIAYSIAFMVYTFQDVSSQVISSNIEWIAKRIKEAVSDSGRGRRMDTAAYFQLREMIRDYLKNINEELTRIDDQPMDVWQHSYNALDSKLKQAVP